MSFSGLETKYQNRDGLFHLKDKNDFVSLLRRNMRKKQIVGKEDRWVKPEGQCDSGDVMGEGCMEGPCVKQQKMSTLEMFAVQ